MGLRGCRRATTKPTPAYPKMTAPADPEPPVFS